MAMKTGRRPWFLVKIIGIVLAVIISFVLPLWLVPKINPNNTLSDFQKDLITSGLAALPTFLALVGSFLYHNIELIYLWVNREWLKLSNAPVSWSLSVEYRESVTPDSVGEIYRELLQQFDDAESLQNNPLEKIVNIPHNIGGVLRLRYADSDELINDNPILTVRIFDLNVPFRKSESAIDSIDWLLSNVVEKHTSTKDAKYTFRVNFGDYNPYYGLYVRRERIPSIEILGFSCEFVDRQGKHEGYIDVSEKRLALVTDNSTDFVFLSKRYVSLSSMDIAPL